MKSTSKWLDDLKLRFSYGTAGNNNIPSGQLTQVYENNTTSWINGISNYWAPSTYMSNPDLKWETTITRNLGLDFTLWGGKLTGSVEAYLNTTKDLLIAFPVSGTGYDYQYRNMGKTENKGLEASFTWHAVNAKNWGIDLNGNIGFNKTKIKSLGMMNDFGAESYWASSEIGNDYWIAVGGSVGQMYGYKSAGRYEVDDFTGYDATKKKWVLKSGVADATNVVGQIRPGSMKLVDQLTVDTDGDGKPDAGDGKIDTSDKTIIGNANPDFTGGFGINAHAYGFDLSANFNFSVGNDIYNANKIEFSTTGKYQYRNMLSTMAAGNRWTNLDPATGLITNDPAMLKELNATTTEFSPYTDRMVFSDWSVEDGSFLRLNTLTLGYTLPQLVTNKMGINSLRFYVTAYNVFCITNYSGYDPEVSTMRRTNLTPGVDYSGYPKSRQFVIGLNLNF
jgi:Outer membrane receptor proteins, mostly Fe transport